MAWSATNAHVALNGGQYSWNTTVKAETGSWSWPRRRTGPRLSCPRSRLRSVRCVRPACTLECSRRMLWLQRAPCSGDPRAWCQWGQASAAALAVKQAPWVQLAGTADGIATAARLLFREGRTGSSGASSGGVHALGPAGGAPVALCPPSLVEHPVQRFDQASNDRVSIWPCPACGLPCLYLKRLPFVPSTGTAAPRYRPPANRPSGSAVDSSTTHRRIDYDPCRRLHEHSLANPTHGAFGTKFVSQAECSARVHRQRNVDMLLFGCKGDAAYSTVRQRSAPVPMTSVASEVSSFLLTQAGQVAHANRARDGPPGV
ncbi:hypothetical protein COCCADRAFT_27196 [Bipolaris zeicola 26-R-13]|uniref:Uncharacterized protein n=1 Tax=Cochliobolus carbonum (strain 26-R-13) TaxID=930089 RepID=W6XXT2_COCC2|nr:uncharacterized protein COCCADRAFT_27196 [Bipolaris zeicola 26-R-13]EUC32257.1 hypothetical protein COCCADRAFT_27196 [Bipolaris zeicola 26-R-13]